MPSKLISMKSKKLNNKWVPGKTTCSKDICSGWDMGECHGLGCTRNILTMCKHAPSNAIKYYGKCHKCRSKTPPKRIVRNERFTLRTAKECIILTRRQIRKIPGNLFDVFFSGNYKRHQSSDGSYSFQVDDDLFIEAATYLKGELGSTNNPEIKKRMLKVGIDVSKIKVSAERAEPRPVLANLRLVVSAIRSKGDMGAVTKELVDRDGVFNIIELMKNSSRNAGVQEMCLNLLSKMVSTSRKALHHITSENIHVILRTMSKFKDNGQVVLRGSSIVFQIIRHTKHSSIKKWGVDFAIKIVLWCASRNCRIWRDVACVALRVFIEVTTKGKDVVVLDKDKLFKVSVSVNRILKKYPEHNVLVTESFKKLL